MNARLVLLIAALLALGAIAVGCGSDSNDGSSTTQAGGNAAAAEEGGSGEESGEEPAEGSTEESTSAEKAAFIKKADAVCAQDREGALGRVAAYKKSHSSEGLSEAELVDDAFRAGLLETIEVEIADLESLSPPPGEEATVEAIIAEMQADLQKAKAMKKPTEPEIVALFVAADEKLEAYGVTGCSKGA